MEEKQLDFNAPLLSVRRFVPSATSKAQGNKRAEKCQPKEPSLPPYKSELKSGPVRNAGAVPFQWEKIPGRRKDEGGLYPRTPEMPLLVPKLPPGRTLDFKQPSSAKCDQDRETEFSAVTRSLQNENFISSADHLSSGGNTNSLENSKAGLSEEQNPILDDSDDDAFSDALDTLSRTDSYLMNCSLSGMTVFDGPDSKHSKSFSKDPHARDFMMDRFLPAAKAMASEAPQYASRKQPVVREPMRQLCRVAGDKKPLPYQYQPYVVPYTAEDEEKEYSEDEEEEYDDTGNVTTKACGLLPRFCLKSSFCLLSPVPGMKIRGHSPTPPVGRKLNTRIKPAAAGYLSEPNYENSWEDVYKHKLACGFQPRGAHESGSKPTSESNQLTYSSDSQTPDGSSPYRRSTGDGISPYRKETPQSPFCEGMGFLGIPQKGKNLKLDALDMHSKSSNDCQEILSSQSSKQGSGSGSPAIEKTLYVDSVQMLETPNSRLSSSDTNDQAFSAEKDCEILVESERLEESSILEDCAAEANRLNILKGSDKLHTAVPEDGTNSPSCMDGPVHREHINNQVRFNSKHGSLDCSGSLLNSSLSFDDRPVKEEDQGNLYAYSMQSPLPPPLPKSPTESWLWRTLPSVSSMNPSLRPYLGIQFRSMKKAIKASSDDPKWENLVKTSNAQHGHLRFSEELKTPLSKQS